MRITIIATGFETAKHAETSVGDCPAIPSKPTPMPPHTNFATGTYTMAGGMQTIIPEAAQPIHPAMRSAAFTAPVAAESAPVASAESTVKEPETIGHVSDDDFDLLMGILNRGKKK